MRCIMHGHNPVRQNGKGQFADHQAVICSDCGRVFELGSRTSDGAGYRQASEVEVRAFQLQFSNPVPVFKP